MPCGNDRIVRVASMASMTSSHALSNHVDGVGSSARGVAAPVATTQIEGSWHFWTPKHTFTRSLHQKSSCVTYGNSSDESVRSFPHTGLALGRQP